MHRNLIRIALMATLATLAAFGGCSSDDPAAPEPGAPAFTLAAGVYRTWTTVRDCSGAEIQTLIYEDVWCSSTVVDEIRGLIRDNYPCTLTPVGSDSVTIDCSGTITEDTCTVSWTATGSGSRVGDNWEIDVHIELTETPPGCSGDETCFDLELTIIKELDRPTACDYADAYSMDVTVAGGPIPGRVPFSVHGSPAAGSGGVAWAFWGSSDPMRGVPEDRYYYLAFNLEEIDPKSLPATVNVTAVGPPRASAGTGSTIDRYSESTDGEPHHFAFLVGGGGTVTVHELSGAHIAGRFNLTIQVETEGEGGGPRRVQEISDRNITGGFWVQTGSAVPRLAEERTAGASIARQIIDSFRQHAQ